jgi:hypothetical protein
VLTGSGSETGRAHLLMDLNEGIGYFDMCVL